MAVNEGILPELEEYTEKIVQINRVSKKTAGGNRFSFSILVVVGDRKGKVGVGLGKAPDVSRGIRKAANYAKKHLVTVPMKNDTIPHEIFIKLGAAKVFLKPARAGTGLVAGGAVRAVLEAAGIKNILSKILGTSNQASNVYATFEAIKRLKPPLVERPTPKVSASEVSSEKVKKTKKERKLKTAKKLSSASQTKKTKKEGKKKNESIKSD